jgi:trimethylamine:corrinoid methyltransferase-like protein
MKTESSLRLLNREEMESIHSFAIKILSSIGVEIKHERAVSLLRAGGCAVKEKGRVTMPENLAEEVIKKVTGRKPKLYNRGSGKEVELDGEPFIMPGPVKPPSLMSGNEGCLFVLDVGANERRAATLDDIGKVAFMADALENVKVLGIPMTPIDAPLETR